MPGAKTISTNAAVQKLVRDYINGGKVVGMICAGKIVIVLLGLYLKITGLSARILSAIWTGPLTALTSGLPRQPITSHPSVQSQLDQRMSFLCPDELFRIDIYNRLRIFK